MYVGEVMLEPLPPLYSVAQRDPNGRVLEKPGLSTVVRLTEGSLSVMADEDSVIVPLSAMAEKHSPGSRAQAMVDRTVEGRFGSA